MTDNLEKSYNSREEVFNFFRDYTKMMFDSSYQKKKMKLKEQDLKY